MIKPTFKQVCDAVANDYANILREGEATTREIAEAKRDLKSSTTWEELCESLGSNGFTGEEAAFYILDCITSE